MITASNDRSAMASPFLQSTASGFPAGDSTDGRIYHGSQRCVKHRQRGRPCQQHAQSLQGICDSRQSY
jgi:hypothetical protein